MKEFSYYRDLGGLRVWWWKKDKLEIDRLEKILAFEVITSENK